MNKGTKLALWVLLISFGIALFWNSFPLIKDTIHFILNPTIGTLLDWNISIGMLVVVFSISLVLSLFQKFTIDQNLLRELKKEQKILQEEIKKYKDHPEKLMELQKKQFEFLPKTMDLTLRPIAYTGIPIVLFFRWFSDYFIDIQQPEKIFGIFSTSGTFIFPSWFWAYLILSIFFSTLFRKLFKLA
mgnify:FL=1